LRFVAIASANHELQKVKQNELRSSARRQLPLGDGDGVGVVVALVVVVGDGVGDGVEPGRKKSTKTSNATTAIITAVRIHRRRCSARR
jgi:hypothetical protein